MAGQKKTGENQIAEARTVLVRAALDHVMFDGWGPDTLGAAARDSGIDETLVRQACPRGAIDLAVAFHRLGDTAMEEALAQRDLSSLRFRDRIALAVRLRLEAVAPDREAVRRGAALFALPQNASEGAALIWGTCDLIWNSLGDTSDDVNWYTKRGTLSAVYSTTLLYWLGDEGAGYQATWEFLDRRIENVMQFETFKANLQKNPLFKSFMDGPGRLFGKIKPPSPQRREDLPGYVHPES